MRRNQRGFVLRTMSWIAGLAILAIAAVFGINATDEELSPAARKLLAETPRATPAGENGYDDFLALDTSGFDKRLRRSCGAVDLTGCLKFAAENPDVVKMAGNEDEFTARYRAMRARPQFVEAYKRYGSPDDSAPSYVPLIWGQGRAQLVAASRAIRGDLSAAIAELEIENAFHRRAAAGAQSLYMRTVMIAVLSRDAYFASELARLPAVRPRELKRLRAIVRPLTGSELEMRKPL